MLKYDLMVENERLKKELQEAKEAGERQYEYNVGQIAHIAELETELNLYEEAARYDALMEGPKFIGWNRSTLDRARGLTEKRRRRGEG